MHGFHRPYAKNWEKQAMSAGFQSSVGKCAGLWTSIFEFHWATKACLYIPACFNTAVSYHTFRTDTQTWIWISLLLWPNQKFMRWDQECFGLLLISQIHQTCSDLFFCNPDKCQKNVFNILSLGHSSAVGSQPKPTRGVRCAEHFGWMYIYIYILNMYWMVLWCIIGDICKMSCI